MICLIETGLSVWVGQSSKDMIEMIEMYNEIKEDSDRFRTFEDSLLGNPNFRKRVLDEAGTVTGVKDVKQKQGDELKRKINDFQKRYRDRQAMITKHKILEGISDLVGIAFVVMAVPFFIHVFKRR